MINANTAWPSGVSVVAEPYNILDRFSEEKTWYIARKEIQTCPKWSCELEVKSPRSDWTATNAAIELTITMKSAIFGRPYMFPNTESYNPVTTKNGKELIEKNDKSHKCRSISSSNGSTVVSGAAVFVVELL